MTTANGFVLRLTEGRYEVFGECLDGLANFAEPVPDFVHSRNAPLVCLVVSEAMKITHVGQGKRGVRAGTGLRRLNIENVVGVHPPVPVETILGRVPRRLRHWASERLHSGGLLTPKTLAAVVDALISLAPSLSISLRRFGQGRAERLSRLSVASLGGLAAQKLAVSTALTLAGLSRDALQEWDPGQESRPASFLDGLPRTYLREDAMVINDLSKLPGYELIRSCSPGIAVFEAPLVRLTVVLANRLPLEEQTGTDLVYFNERFRSFVMVQYKAMEREANEAVFRLPDSQLDLEIDRMRKLRDKLQSCPPSSGKDGYRLSNSPFFLKLCPRIVFDPDDVGLIPGMYLPLDYWSVLSTDPSIKGPKGGSAVSYRNVGRYFNNTEFVTMVSKAWVGTTVEQSAVLETLIRSVLESGKALVLGVKTESQSRLPESIDDDEPTTEPGAGMGRMGTTTIFQPRSRPTRPPSSAASKPTTGR